MRNSLRFTLFAAALLVLSLAARVQAIDLLPYAPDLTQDGLVKTYEMVGSFPSPEGDGSREDFRAFYVQETEVTGDATATQTTNFEYTWEGNAIATVVESDHRYDDQGFYTDETRVTVAIPGFGEQLITTAFTDGNIEFPRNVEIGGTYEIESSATVNLPFVGDTTINYTGTITVEAEETVTVPAGAFTALRIRREETSSQVMFGVPIGESTTETSFFWLAEGVGVVKSTLDTTDPDAEEFELRFVGFGDLRGTSVLPFFAEAVDVGEGFQYVDWLGYFTWDEEVNGFWHTYFGATFPLADDEDVFWFWNGHPDIEYMAILKEFTAHVDGRLQGYAWFEGVQSIVYMIENELGEFWYYIFNGDLGWRQLTPGG